jgi:hypothetical protein
MAGRSFEVPTRVNDTPEVNRFCTRCGSQVDPYQSNESLGHDEYWDYYTPLATAPLRQPGDHAYQCSTCQARWCAFGSQDTGNICPCGHFMPGYVAYCGLCGVRAGPTDAGTSPGA